MVLLHYNMYFN